VKMVEQYIGTQVDHVSYKDMSFLDMIHLRTNILLDHLHYLSPSNVFWSIKNIFGLVALLGDR
jgi:hypothetical protein